MAQRTKIRVPLCWKRLIDECFELLDGGIYVEGTNRLVRSEKHEHPIDDHDAYYDEVRHVTATFEDGSVATLRLMSGQDNYYGGVQIDSKDGEPIFEEDMGDPIESLSEEIEVQVEDGETYILELDYYGEDPYAETVKA